jgi:hypothetical protein
MTWPAGPSTGSAASDQTASCRCLPGKIAATISPATGRSTGDRPRCQDRFVGAQHLMYDRLVTW